MPRRLPVALLLIWQLLAPSGLVWANVLPAHIVQTGADYAREFHLTPGVTLTKEQVAALSRDIVWLETRKVAGQDVLVPVVYLGASYTPRSASALMGGGKSTTITADNIRNNGGTISGETLTLTAANDIVNESGAITGQDVRLTAGRDIKIGTTGDRLS